jgi:3-methyladenine DNA glycosylase Tag
MTISFNTIYKIAAKRKEGDAELMTLLPPISSKKNLSEIPSHRFLSVMTKCIFQSGFVWRVIEKKWPDFEKVFFNFDLKKLINLPPKAWEAYSQDARIVRNHIKISTVYENAMMILDIEAEHNCTFGEFIANWPDEELIDLLALLKKRGSRLGGMTGQYFLRRMGKDSFMLSQDVVSALRHAGLDIKDSPTSKGDLRRIQDQFNTWKKETKLPLTHLSKVLAYSIGENNEAELITNEMNKFEKSYN